MALDSKTVYVTFTGGLDTKSDEKTVLPSELTVLENGDFTEQGSVRARAGYRSVAPRDQTGAPIADPHGLHSLRDGWVLFTRRAAYNFDGVRNRWSLLGPYVPATHTARAVASTPVAQSAPQLATAGDLTGVVWEDSRGGVRVSLLNDATGGTYVSEYVLAAANASKPLVVAVGPNLLVTWFDEVLDNIVGRVVKVSDPYGSVTGADSFTLENVHADGIYDLVGSPDNAFLAYRRDAALATGIALARINAGGTVVQTTLATSDLPSTVRLAHEGTDAMVWMAYYKTSTPASVNLAAYAAADLTAGSTATAAFAGTYSNHAVGINETGGPSTWIEQSAADAYNYLVTVVRGDATGTTTGSDTVRHAKVASSGWFDGAGSNCVLWCDTSARTNLQSSYFLYRDDAVVWGRALYGSADSMLSTVGATTAVVSRVSNVEDTETWQCALAYREIVRSNADKVTGVGVKLSPVYTHRQVRRLVLSHDAPVSAAEVDGVLYASGSMLWAIDGQGAPVEQAPLMFPEVLAASYAEGAAGNLDNAEQYNYRWYYEFYYGRGKRLRSASVETRHTMAAAKKLGVTLPTLAHTRLHARSQVAIVGFRSEGNAAGLNYRVTSSNPAATGDNGYVANSLTADTVAFTDNLGDSSITDRELDYPSFGESWHFAPDAPAQVVTAQNRLFAAAGGEKPETVQYSLTRTDAGALEFTDVSFVSELPEQGGALVALSRMDDRPVVLQRRAVLVLDGAGFTNTGAGDQYRPVPVSSDVGCSNARVAVAWGQGVAFQSDKGIYGLTQNGQVGYLGAKVERYNTQVYAAAHQVPDTNMIVFLCAGDTERTVMYDYFYSAWGTYTNHSGLASAVTAADYAYLRTDGALFVRDTSLHTDGGNYYRLKFRTGPVRLDGLENFYLMRKFQALGDYKSAHKIRVSTYYDSDDFPFQVSEWNPDDVLNTLLWGEETPYWGSAAVWYGDNAFTDYHFERKFRRQRCRAVRFEFEGFPSASPGAAFEITEFALEVALLPGLKRLAKTRKT